MELTMFDHLISLFLLVLMPIWGVWDFQKLEGEVQKGRPFPRIRFYRKTLIMEWGLTALVLVMWVVAGRALPEIGLTFALASWWWLGAILTGAAVLFMIVQLVTVSRDPEKLKAMQAEFQSLRAMLPDNDRETRWFNGLSVTAGICEEIIYRGFLIAYFSAFVGWLPALLLSSFVFGLGHAYQGWQGVVRVSVIGLVMGGIYLLTGSLWAPIVLHAILDITSGMLGRRSMEGAPPMLEPARPIGQQ